MKIDRSDLNEMTALAKKHLLELRGRRSIAETFGIGGFKADKSYLDAVGQEIITEKLTLDLLNRISDDTRLSGECIIECERAKQ